MVEPIVPGEFYCSECGFGLIKSIIYTKSGNISRDSADTLELCPNDGTILRPVLYSVALNEARKQAIVGMILLRKLKDYDSLIHGLVHEAETRLKEQDG